jgi:uracil-DNA glycosylase
MKIFYVRGIMKLFDNFPPAWRTPLSSFLNTEGAKRLDERVCELYEKGVCYPDFKNIFRVFELCPFENVRVVIIGQDPYFNGAANGLAFSISRGVPMPASLKNILTAVKADTGVCHAADGDLSAWAGQGVILLNAVLTVSRGAAGSHRGIGWEGFSAEVVKQIDRRDGVVYLLWGNDARAFKRLITNPKSVVLETSHPSPLGAYRGFLTAGHFKRANEVLNPPIKF